MRSLFALTAVLVAFAVTPYAAETQTSNLTVESDKLEVDNQKREALFSGNVKVVDADMTLNASKLNVDYSEDKKAEGIRQLTATGNVVISRQNQGTAETATGDTATYSPATRILTLTGNVTLTHGKNTLKGSKLVYNMATGKATVTSTNRVQGQFSGQTE